MSQLKIPMKVAAAACLLASLGFFFAAGSNSPDRAVFWLLGGSFLLVGLVLAVSLVRRFGVRRRLSRTSGRLFLAAGLAYLVAATVGHQTAFLGVAVVFLVTGMANLARAGSLGKP